jgi:outer membrane protein assembly factor BamE (lipoprotein component of BamABCDE complex)
LTKKFNGPVRLLALAAIATMLPACGSLRVHRGAVIDTQLVTTIQPGIDNKESVEKLLGRPTFTGQFTPDEWYYVSRDTTQFAFRNPRISKQNVLLIRFDKDGNVAATENYGKEWAMAIDPADRTTPTLGRKRGFFEELMGGIGSVGGGLPTQQ